ncbi:hypothetical protein EZV62_001671 [Acer yangbiense]|uniref:Uncharacterized protein n=1 Tax=Acer yangbiense TaxID=1000413 RepID=A0A5C7IX35_9ROSI|nr:hypothetical protein EZV62_001671 [Acer yangbiense]
MSDITDATSSIIPLTDNHGPVPPTDYLPNVQPNYRLTDKNYLKWSQFVQTFLKGKGKLSHLLGIRPPKEDPKYAAWDEADSMVMSWLWNSMAPEISDTCMFLKTAQDIWDICKQTYSRVHDTAQIYDIKTRISNTKQGTHSVTEYANILQNLWQELDYYQCIKMEGSKDAATLRRFLEKERIYVFLAGLNIEFDAVRVQVLGKEDLPSLNEAIGIIRGEESRRGVMLESKTVERSAMIMKEAKKGDRCWKLHGKPSNLQNLQETNRTGTTRSNQGQAHISSSQPKGEIEVSSDNVEFNREQIAKLKQMLENLDKPSGLGNCSLASSEDKQRDLFLLDLSTHTPVIPDPITLDPQTANPNLSTVPTEQAESSGPIVTTPQLAPNMLPPSEPTQSQGATRPLQVYTRREAPFLQPVQHQESDTDLGIDKGAGKIEVNSNPKTDEGGVSDSICSTNDNLPIAVRKGVRECTKRPLYPLSQYVSYERQDLFRDQRGQAKQQNIKRENSPKAVGIPLFTDNFVYFLQPGNKGFSASSNKTLNALGSTVQFLYASCTISIALTPLS